MPWKLISFLLTLIVAALFIGFNLENRCDVSFIFHVFKDVPIFVSLLFSYVVGAITVIPFFWVYRKKSSSKGTKKSGNKTAQGQKYPKSPYTQNSGID